MVGMDGCEIVRDGVLFLFYWRGDQRDIQVRGGRQLKSCIRDMVDTAQELAHSRRDLADLVEAHRIVPEEEFNEKRLALEAKIAGRITELEQHKSAILALVT